MSFSAIQRATGGQMAFPLARVSSKLDASNPTRSARNKAALKSMQTTPAWLARLVLVTPPRRRPSLRQILKCAGKWRRNLSCSYAPRQWFFCQKKMVLIVLYAQTQWRLGLRSVAWRYIRLLMVSSACPPKMALHSWSKAMAKCQLYCFNLSINSLRPITDKLGQWHLLPLHLWLLPANPHNVAADLRLMPIGC